MSKHLWEHLKMPRPWKYKSPLKARSITFTQDQDALLDAKDNASQYIRDLVDQDVLSEERPVSLVAILSKLGALKRERNDLLDVVVIDASDFDISRLESEVEAKMGTVHLTVQGGEVYQEVYEDGDYELYLLPLNEGDLKRFGREHQVMEGDDETEYSIRRSRYEFLELVQGALAPDKGVVARVEARLGEVDAEIEKLEAHLSSVTSGKAR